jgi:teichuronic acid exporter
LKLTLKDTAAKNILWSAIERFSVQGVQFFLTIIIARLVAPEDYGLIAMLAIFLAIAQSFIDSGFSNALIQNQVRSETDCSTVFFFNIFIALVFYFILYFISPAIANFYERPILRDLTRLVSLSIIISSFSNVHLAINIIAHDFKTQAKSSLLSILISGILGIILAYNGYGVWALVIQSLTNQLLFTIFLWKFTKWHPILVFSRKSFKTLFSFGSRLLVSGLLHTIYMNLYSIIIGKLYSASKVGYFNQANTLSNFLSINITNILTRAVYPIQCELQNDKEKLKIVLIQYKRITIFIIFPLLVGVYVLSEPLIHILLTDKWMPSVNLLKILCVANIFYPLMVLNNNILNVVGRSDLFLKAEIVKKILGISILLSTMHFGLTFLCIGLVIYNFFDLIIIIFFVKKVINISYKEEFANIMPTLSITIIMGILMFLVISYLDSQWIKLLLGFTVGLFSYLGLAFLFKFHEILVVFFTLKKFINKKSF